MSITPQLLIHVNDPDLGLLGYVAIDSFIGNKAYGGIRVKISDNVRDDKAHPAEAAHLAQEMSLKFGFHEIPSGGAKSVIVLPPNLSQEQRDNYFKAFGRQLSPLLQKDLLQIGMDMGMTGRDLHLFGQGVGLIPWNCEPPSGREKSDSGRFTAIGLIETFKATRDFYSLTDRPLTCSLEGVGSVGSHLAQYLMEMGVKVTAISTLTGGLCQPEGLDVKGVIALQEAYGDNLVDHYDAIRRIKKEDLYTQKVDILFPCGGLFSINPGNVNRLQCKFIIAGANCAMDAECAERLHNHGIGYIPGFAANAGSVLKNYVAKQEKTNRVDILERRIRELFGQRVEQLLKESKKNNLSVYEQAVNIARNNIREMSRQSVDEKFSLRRRIISLWKR